MSILIGNMKPKLINILTKYMTVTITMEIISPSSPSTTITMEIISPSSPSTTITMGIISPSSPSAQKSNE